jgi:hypothetical protein
VRRSQEREGESRVAIGGRQPQSRGTGLWPFEQLRDAATSAPADIDVLDGLG